MIAFEFYRFRFHFRALDAVRFAPGKSADAIRGALGAALHSGSFPGIYSRLFSPGGTFASGFGDAPRPFVLRASHLEGVAIPPGTSVYFDVHVFDIRAPLLETFQQAFALAALRRRMELVGSEQIDFDDQPHAGPLVIPLNPEEPPVRKITLRFVTPTELKVAGGLAASPEFPVLFARLRDRISTLRALYGAGPLDIDFPGIGERAASVRMVRADLAWTSPKRKSSRTGQVHSIGGFTGEAEYEGRLGEFLPWLRAARWVGVGRQTVWGKGDVRVVIL